MKEVFTRKDEVEAERRQDKRSGQSITTSVSVSREFDEQTRQLKLSPTEIYRRGLAVTFADMGVKPYDNPLNQKRLDVIRNYIKLQETLEIIPFLEGLSDKSKQLADKLKEIIKEE